MNDYAAIEAKFAHLFALEYGGIECGPGWYVWVEDLVESLNALPERYGTPGISSPIRIRQIKKKGSEPRCYVECNDEKLEWYVDRVVHMFLGRCSVTCVRCGRMEHKLIPNVCDQCKEEIGDETPQDSAI